METQQQAQFRMACLEAAARLASEQGWDEKKVLEVAKTFAEFVVTGS